MRDLRVKHILLLWREFLRRASSAHQRLRPARIIGCVQRASDDATNAHQKMNPARVEVSAQCAARIRVSVARITSSAALRIARAPSRPCEKGRPVSRAALRVNASRRGVQRFGTGRCSTPL
jgi:hypothetical protein